MEERWQFYKNSCCDSFNYRDSTGILCISSQIEPRIEEFVHLSYPAMNVKQQGKTMKQMWLSQITLRVETGRKLLRFYGC